MEHEFQAQSLEASLTVNNLEQSIEWYSKALGFAVEKRHEREGQLFAVSIKAGNVKLLLTQDNGAKGADRTKGEGMSLQLTTEQPLEAIASRIKECGTMLDMEPTKTPWGVTVLRVRDLDGFRFAISSTYAE